MVQAMRTWLRAVVDFRVWPTATPSEAAVSYDEIFPQHIEKINECARSAFANGNWMTEKREL